MKYIFKCGCESSQFSLIYVNIHQKAKVCVTHGSRMSGKIFTCIEPDCGIEIRTSVNGGKVLRCPPHALEHKRQLVREYKKQRPDRTTEREQFKSTRIGTDAAAHARANILTSMLPDPVIKNPYQSPCTQGCSVFLTLGTYDNTACSSCRYRWSYAGMPYTQPAPEYTYQVRV